MPDVTRLWTVPFTLAILATLSVFTGFYFMIPAIPSYASNLGASESMVGVIVGIYSAAAIVVRLLTGSRIDSMGRKRCLVAGLTIYVIAAAAYGSVESLGMLLTLRIIHGAGWAWITTTIASLVSDVVPARRRGEAIGYWGLAPTIAMAVGPLTGGLLLDRFGAERTFLATAAFAAVALVMVFGIHDPRHASGAHVAQIFPRGALLPAITLFLSSLSYGALIAFLPIHLVRSRGMAGMFFAIYAGAILFSRPFAGRLGDRFGRSAIIIPGLVLSAAGIFVVGYASTIPMLTIAALLYGVGASGLSFPGLMALTIDRSGSASRSYAMALFFIAYDLAIAMGAAAMGPIYQRGGFAAVNIVTGIAIVISIAVYAAATFGEKRRIAP